ncbi:MAG: methylmalonyl-CoA mutase, partial [candidate division Zixibacteria bacterium]|nr:methylmalonyl-CoA mutase [candidate division Zixibacteria bacterium]
IVRTAYEAMSAAMGGTQSLHTNSMDETLALPSDKAALIALRTQQVLAHETGIVNTIDPLAGSYFVEGMTNRIEKQALEYFDEIDKRGGVLKGIESGYFQREIARAAYQFQQEIDKKERIIVGVNDYIMEGEELDIDILKIDEKAHEEQMQSIQKAKEMRDNDKVSRTLEELKKVAATPSDNTMPHIIEAVKAYATMGEICDVFREVYGEYVETPEI